jgi:hypothetical protein
MESAAMNIEQLYRQDIVDIPDWRGVPEEQRQEIIDQARQGDNTLREYIACSMLSTIIAYACRFQSSVTDVMDLIGVGNLIIIEHMSDALQTPNPHGYLLNYASGEMKQYRRRYENAITLSTTPGDDPYTIIPLSRIDADDIPEEGGIIRSIDDHTPLHEALKAIPSEKGRELMVRLFGLFDEGQEDMSTLAGGNSTTRVYQAVKARKLNYLNICRHFLEKYCPRYVEQHTRETVSRTPKYCQVHIPEITLKKLKQAESTLRERGELLSMNKLRILSGVNTRYASAYLETVDPSLCIERKTGRIPKIYRKEGRETCEQCGGPLTQLLDSGRARCYCSDHCRQQASYQKRKRD